MVQTLGAGHYRGCFGSWPMIQRPSGDGIEALRLDLQLQEIRGELKGMPEGGRIAAAMRAAERADLRRLWALDDAPMPMVNRDALREVQQRIAVEREPWRKDLIEYREDVHRAAVELTAETYQFIRASLGRLETNHGLKAHVAPLEAFGGQRELSPEGAVAVFSSARSRA